MTKIVLVFLSHFFKQKLETNVLRMGESKLRPAKKVILFFIFIFLPGSKYLFVVVDVCFVMFCFVFGTYWNREKNSCDF